jgi:hypothetical protein
LASLALLGGLSGAATGLSVTHSPRQLIVVPPPNDPAAARALRQALEKTLSAQSLTAEYRDLLDDPHIPTTAPAIRFIYQAPDRSEQDEGDVTTLTIGNTTYTRGLIPGVAPQWSAFKAPFQQAPLPTRVFLSPLLAVTNVERSGNTFRAEEAELAPPSPAPFSDPGGTREAVLTMVVANGYVVSENVLTRTISYHHKFVITYGDFGTAPPVNPPPADEVIHR